MNIKEFIGGFLLGSAIFAGFFGYVIWNLEFLFVLGILGIILVITFLIFWFLDV